MKILILLLILIPTSICAANTSFLNKTFIPTDGETFKFKKKETVSLYPLHKKIQKTSFYNVLDSAYLGEVQFNTEKDIQIGMQKICAQIPNFYGVKMSRISNSVSNSKIAPNAVFLMAGEEGVANVVFINQENNTTFSVFLTLASIK